MDKLEEFKNFVRNNTFLISYIKQGKSTWQDFYEMYDLYGDNEEAWNKYLEETPNPDATKEENHNYLNEMLKIAKNIDVNKVQEGITSLQKTLGLFGDLFASKEPTRKNYNPRPLYRRFED